MTNLWINLTKIYFIFILVKNLINSSLNQSYDTLYKMKTKYKKSHFWKLCESP